MRSSPQVGLFVAISTIDFCRSAGTRGRPRGRDFHFQNTRNPLRCQRISVSGWTTVRALRQSKKREGWASVKRMELVARRGLIFSLNVEAELFAEEQILGGNSSR